MVDSALLLTVVSLVALASCQGKHTFLPVLVAIEFVTNQFLDEVLILLGFYTFENISTIILIRFLISAIAGIIILKYRQRCNWVIIGLLYVVVLLFQFCVFVESSIVPGVLVDNYSYVIQVLSALIVLSLVINHFGISRWLRSIRVHNNAVSPPFERHQKGDH